MKTQYKIFIAIGIIASIMMIAADYLLGYTNPEMLGDNFIILKGYQNFSSERAVISMGLAMAAILLYLLPMYAFKFTITNKSKGRVIYIITAMLASMSWLYGHLYVCMPVINYTYLYNLGYTELAYESSTYLVEMFLPISRILTLIMVIPFFIYTILVLMKKTIFPRWYIIVNPLFFVLTFTLLYFFLPKTAISYALKMGAFNEGMLIWFVVSLLYINKHHKHKEVG